MRDRLADRFELRIGGVALAVRSRLPILHDEPEEAYRSFLKAGGKPRAGATMVVEVREGSLPDLAGLKPVFDGDAWRMYTGRGCRWIAQVLPGTAGPLWVARLARGVTGVTVYGSPRLGRLVAGRRGILNPIRYPLDQLLLMYALAGRDGVLCHGAGAVGGRQAPGCLLAGRSGAGKTTVSRLLNAAGWRVLSDDRVVVRRRRGRYELFGTPWPGEGGMAENGSVPLGALFFLEHGRRNRLVRLAAPAAVERLLAVSSIPWFDGEMAPRVLETCGRLAAAVPAFVFRFTPDARGVAALKAALAALARRNRQAGR